MNIRPAAIDDLEEVAALLVETQDLHIAAYPEIYKPLSREDAENFLRQQLDRQEVSIRVACVDGVTAGYCFSEHRVLPETLFSYQRRLTYINQVAVKTSHRNAGIAAALIEDVILIAKQREDQRIELDVWEFNKGAKTAFSKVGFEDFGSRMRLVLER